MESQKFISYDKSIIASETYIQYVRIPKVISVNNILFWEFS